MQFYSNRSINFGISLEGRRLIVMFGDSSGANVSSFITQDDKVADAIRRHSYYKKHIIWEVEDEAESVELKAESVELKAESVELKAEGLELKAEDLKLRAADVVTSDEADADEKTFANFTEAKEWLCKTYGIAKTTVRNPTSLTNKANELGITIKIG